jgi:hypothetical protein
MIVPVSPGGLRLATLVDQQHLGFPTLLAELVGCIDGEQESLTLAFVGAILLAIELDDPSVFPAGDQVTCLRAVENKRWSGRFVMDFRSTHVFPVFDWSNGINADLYGAVPHTGELICALKAE